MYGNWFTQIVVLVVEVTFGFTVRFSVATESHPAALTSVTLYVPAPAYEFALQVYGNWFTQIVVLVVEVTFGFTVRFSVATESHPAALTSVTLYVPAPAYEFALQVYGNWFTQIVVLVVEVTNIPLLIIKRAKSAVQPLASVTVTV